MNDDLPIEARIAGAVAAELWRTTRAYMCALEGPDWPGPDVDELAFGHGENGQIVLEVGQARYVFGADDSIVETTRGRVRIIRPGGIVDADLN